jgi:hypothetical protein
MHDPAEASVRINKLSRELNDIIAFAARPDLNRLVEVATEIRAQANSVRLWAFGQQEGKSE